MDPQKYNYPLHGWIGLIIIFFSWIGNWTLLGIRTHLLFFPLWLGYILVVDGLVYKRKGHSLIKRNGEFFFVLFLLSTPVWWIFEILNEVTQNWSYVGKNFFHPLEYFILSSISFSTVIPAIIETAELFGSFKIISQATPFFKLPQKYLLLSFLILGLLLFIGLFLMPEYFFPVLWIAPFFILDPVNAWQGRVSLMRQAQQGDWRTITALWTGAITCGFFWEMWNFYSFPKWIYHIPHVDFFRIFEMPILGYLGYLPFSLVLFSVVIMVFKIDDLNQFKEFQILHDL